MMFKGGEISEIQYGLNTVMCIEALSKATNR